jgi:hypothetical protein
VSSAGYRQPWSIHPKQTQEITQAMPSTPKKIAANRANAQKSTGPRTPEGRIRAALNSLKHGLNSKHVVVPGEVAADFADFRRALQDEFQPADADQALLFEHMVAAAWRLRRIRRLETNMFDALLVHKEESLADRYDNVNLNHGQFENALLFRDCAKDFLCLSHYETRIYNQYRRSRADLIAKQAAALKAKAEAQTEAEAQAQAKAQAQAGAEAQRAQAEAPAKTPSKRQNPPANPNKTEKIRVIGFVPPDSSPTSPGNLPTSSGAKENR